MLVVLAATAVLGVGVVRAVEIGPGKASVKAAPRQDHNAHGQGAPARAGGHGGAAATALAPPTLDSGRYALRLARQVVPTGTRRFGFEVIDVTTGKPITEFEDDMTKKLHLIVVREDLVEFQHVHPTLDEGGRWTTTEAVLGRAGPWRLIADFIPHGGERTVLSATLHATGGRFRARPLRESPRAGEHVWRAETAGYEVHVAAEGYAARRSGTLRFTVERGGEPVTDLQQYLGALGHAVLLRAGDVAYTHVHPHEGPPEPGEIEFEVSYPAAAPLALFLQFRHRGRVHTAAFALPTPPAQPEPEPQPDQAAPDASPPRHE